MSHKHHKHKPTKATKNKVTEAKENESYYNQLNSEIKKMKTRVTDFQKSVNIDSGKIRENVTKLKDIATKGASNIQSSAVKLKAKLPAYENLSKVDREEISRRVAYLTKEVRALSNKGIDQAKTYYKDAKMVLADDERSFSEQAKKQFDRLSDKVTNIRERIKDSTRKNLYKETAKSTVDLINLNVIDIKRKVVEAKEMTDDEIRDLKRSFETVEHCYQELQRDLNFNRVSLSSSDKRTFLNLGIDIASMKSKLGGVKKNISQSVKAEVIPLFKNVEKECTDLRDKFGS